MHKTEAKIEINEDGMQFVAEGELVSDLPRPIVPIGSKAGKVIAVVDVTDHGTIKFQIGAKINPPAAKPEPKAKAKGKGK